VTLLNAHLPAVERLSAERIAVQQTMMMYPLRKETSSLLCEAVQGEFLVSSWHILLILLIFL
jgi:hypothetical protein